MSSNDTPTSCNASDRPAARDRVGADDASVRSVGRRPFLKGIGASAVGAAGLASSTQPANAFVITGTTALLVGGAIAGAAGGAGLAYLARDEIESVLGQGEDLSGYTGKDALIAQIKEQ